LIAPIAFAQSSVGRAANAATGQSLRDAVEQIQNDLMDREVLGKAADDAAAGPTGGSAQGGGLGAAVTPTGRLRSSRHDALKVRSPDDSNYAWKAHEGSAFATGVYAVPGTLAGGQLKLSIFGGENWLSLKMRNGGGNMLDTANGQQGLADNQSTILGGTALWSKVNTYAVATIVGLWGDTTLKDAIDFCENPPVGCTLRRYSFSTSGLIGSLAAGHVYTLSGSASGPMLDLRASTSYTENSGATFANFEGDTQKYRFETWTVTGAATLFANIAMPGSALLRPYLQAYVRQEVDYLNRLHFDRADPTEVPNSGFSYRSQAHTYAGVDLGVTYAVGKMTFGSAVYYDASADERTLGARLGVSWKLN
jgi:hypothetical protein